MIARPIPFGLLLLGLAGCGKLADDVFCASAGCDWKAGEWERMEAYVSKRSEARFSHGFCPSCWKANYPEFVDDAHVR